MHESERDTSSVRTVTGVRTPSRALRAAAAGVVGLCAATASILALASGVSDGKRADLLKVFPAKRERAVVVYTHGGGWLSTETLGNRPHGPGQRTARRLNRAGITLVDVNYRDGADSIRDTLRAFARVSRRERWRSTRICSLGFSAGGHLALVTAMRRSPDCAVSLAGPTNLFSLNEGHLARLRSWFPDRRLRALSPRFHPDRFDAPALLYGTRCDPMVSYSDQKRLAQLSPAVHFRDVSAAPRGVGALHCRVSGRDHERMWNGLARFIVTGKLPPR